jgi:hypothetical protein
MTAPTERILRLILKFPVPAHRLARRIVIPQPEVDSPRRDMVYLVTWISDTAFRASLGFGVTEC